VAKRSGAAVVLVGCVLCSAGAPTTAQTEFTSEEVADLFSQTAGLAWFLGLAGAVVVCIALMCAFERRYPTADLTACRHRLARCAPDAPLPDTSDLRLAPMWMENLMALIYPGSLGLDEAIVHICLRAGNGMSTTCEQGGCTHWIYPVVLSLWLTTAMATLWWLRVVFKRYETTVALPVEYGAMTAADVVSGLVFFKEYSKMDAWQIAVVICGVVVCLAGIQIGRMGSDSHLSVRVSVAATVRKSAKVNTDTRT